MKFPYITVVVSYKDMDFGDDVLKSVATKYGGKNGGSGYNFTNGLRDIDFDFKQLDEAAKFLSHVKRFKKVKSAKSYSRLSPSDCY